LVLVGFVRLSERGRCCNLLILLIQPITVMHSRLRIGDKKQNVDLSTKCDESPLTLFDTDVVNYYEIKSLRRHRVDCVEGTY